MPSRFFDPTTSLPTREEIELIDFYKETEENLIQKSAESLLITAQKALKQLKNIDPALSPLGTDKLKDIHQKALTTLQLAAKKYETSQQVNEAIYIYDLIISQIDRTIGAEEKLQLSTTKLSRKTTPNPYRAAYEPPRLK